MLAVQETEKRLKDLVAGKKSAATANANGISKKSQLARTSNRLVVTVSSGRSFVHPVFQKFSISALFPMSNSNGT